MGRTVGLEAAADVHVAAGEEPRAEAEVVGAVVVPGDRDDGDPGALDHLAEEGVEEADGLGAGEGAVVEVAGEDERVDALVAEEGHHLVERVALVVEGEVPWKTLPRWRSARWAMRTHRRSPRPIPRRAGTGGMMRTATR